MQQQTTLETIHSLKSFSEKYPDICPEQSLRWQISQRHQNGLEESGALFKKNGRWFFDEVKYSKWLRTGTREAHSQVNPLDAVIGE